MVEMSISSEGALFKILMASLMQVLCIIAVVPISIGWLDNMALTLNLIWCLRFRVLVDTWILHGKSFCSGQFDHLQGTRPSIYQSNFEKGWPTLNYWLFMSIVTLKVFEMSWIQCWTNFFFQKLLNFFS